MNRRIKWPKRYSTAPMDDLSKSMPFLDHLEELRWRLIKSLGSVLVGALITFFYIDPLIDFLIKPTKDLTTPMDLQVLKVHSLALSSSVLATLYGDSSVILKL